MAAREYQLEINATDATLVSIEKVLDLPRLRKTAAELEVEAGVPNLWDDPEAAQKITSRLSRVQSEIAKLSGLRQRVEDLPILFELAAGEPGGIEDAEKELDAVKKSVSELEVQTLLNGEYDSPWYPLQVRNKTSTFFFFKTSSSTDSVSHEHHTFFFPDSGHGTANTAGFGWRGGSGV